MDISCYLASLKLSQGWVVRKFDLKQNKLGLSWTKLSHNGSWCWDWIHLFIMIVSLSILWKFDETKLLWWKCITLMKNENFDENQSRKKNHCFDEYLSLWWEFIIWMKSHPCCDITLLWGQNITAVTSNYFKKKSYHCNESL